MAEPILDIATIEQLSKAELIKAIDWLITHDFEKLVFILYRIDVSEAKIKTLLDQANTTDAAPVIAEAIIQRLAEKKELFIARGLKEGFVGYDENNKLVIL